MYQLKIKKYEELKIQKLAKVFENNRTELEKRLEGSDYGLIQYNENYIFSHDRKLLKTLAQQMKDNWIMDLSIELENVKNIKV